MSLRILVEEALRKGRTRTEIIALYGLSDTAIDDLESDPDTARDFKRAETEAYLDLVDQIRQSISQPKYANTALALYMTNRYGWQAKTARMSTSVRDAQSLLAGILTGDIDVDVGYRAMQTIALDADTRRKDEELNKIKPLLDVLEKYKLDNNL